MSSREAFKLLTGEVHSRLFHSDKPNTTSGGADGEGERKEKAFQLATSGLGNFIFRDKDRYSKSGDSDDAPSQNQNQNQTQLRSQSQESTEEEAYQLASEELHSKLSKSLNLGENANNDAAFKLLSGAIGSALFKTKGKTKTKVEGEGGSNDGGTGFGALS
jgi:hypothetical protein